MMSKKLNKINQYFIHCSVVEKNNKGIMLIGDPGAGKTTLSLYLSMNKDFHFVCNDRALLRFRDGTPYVPVTYVLFLLTYPTSASHTILEKYDTSKRQDLSILKTMGCFSQYIRADNNMLISAEYPFPSFDTHELACKRLKDVKKFICATEMYSARGDIKVLAEMIDKLVV